MNQKRDFECSINKNRRGEKDTKPRRQDELDTAFKKTESVNAINRSTRAQERPKKNRETNKKKGTKRQKVTKEVKILESHNTTASIMV